MLVHPSWLAKHETQFVMKLLRDQLGQYVYPVHRLDRPTSGVLLFALDSHSAHLLSQAFEQRQVKKVYWAVVRGWLTTGLDTTNDIFSGSIDDTKQITGRIDYPLSIIRDKIADKHSREDKPKQAAMTDWQLLATTEQAFQARTRYPTSRYSWVQLTPYHGRKHQLRRHMKHIFHPIVGDTSYGDHHQNRAIRQHVGVSRLMLHARQLTFPDLSQYSSTQTASQISGHIESDPTTPSVSHTGKQAALNAQANLTFQANPQDNSTLQFNLTLQANSNTQAIPNTQKTDAKLLANKQITVTAPVDAAWLALATQFGWS